MNATLLPRALAVISIFALGAPLSPTRAQSVQAATSTAAPATAHDRIVSPSPVASNAAPVEPAISPSAAAGIATEVPANAVPVGVQTPIALPPLEGDSAPLRIAVANVTSPSGLANVKSRFRFALVNALRGAFGSANVSDGPDRSANVVLSAVLAQTAHGYDLAIAASDDRAGGQSSGHVRFPSTSKPVVPVARIVTLVDRTLAPTPDATEPPVIALAPLSMPAQFHDRATALTNLLASRIGAASGATVHALTESEAGDPAAIDALRPRVLMNGSVVTTGGEPVLHVAAFANGASELADLDLPLHTLSTLPAASAFAPFVTASLDDAPEVQPFGPAFDIAVLPFTSAPGLELAAEAARTALTDCMVAAGYYARAVDTAPEDASTFTANLAKMPAGYELAIAGRSGTSGATVSTTISLAAPAQMPVKAAVGKLVAATKFALGPETSRFVYLPFPDPAANDSYVTFANAQFTAAIERRGYKTVTNAKLGADEATLDAPQLCRDYAAQGILIANSIDHDQDYHKGALRTFGSVLGFFTAGIGEALVNGVNGVASDDRYVNHAILTATLVDCNAKPLWHDTASGENAHVGTNGGDGSGAISDAADKLATSLFAAPGLR